MKYVMFVVHEEDATDADHASAPDVEAWFAEMRDRGTYVSGTRLHERETATTIRVRGGEMVVSDGPFTEAKEWVAGFAVLECADLDEAIEVASKNPAAHYGRVEVRPIHSSDTFE
ncbi:YciI family protein [Nocardioides sp. LS1]|uniref:YciI family protein n=1 Tax=Nocardioides sp. LS1 TaxID=1027620 RepID=UPI000F621BEE|nr:YciI family protein [Nocardioides sp. LS1]GCD90258.1 transcription initiation protein [Nocardioides sp. LS1]